MIFSIEPFSFNDEFVYFSDKSKNNIIENSLFHRILYSHQYFTMNGICIHFTLNINRIELNYDKVKHWYSMNDIYNNGVIKELERIEIEILNKLLLNKSPTFHINKKMNDMYIKICNKTNKLNNKINTSYEISNFNDKYYVNNKSQKQLHNSKQYTLNTYNTIQKNTISAYNFLLKISGVWETDTSYGITYKYEIANESIHQ